MPLEYNLSTGGPSFAFRGTRALGQAFHLEPEAVREAVEGLISTSEEQLGGGVGLLVLGRACGNEPGDSLKGKKHKGRVIGVVPLKEIPLKGSHKAWFIGLIPFLVPSVLCFPALCFS